MNQPLVSVVTPFHNTASYLSQCIESVLSQSYRHFEYILVDNCSTDRSGEIAAAYAARDPRIRLICRSHLLSQVQNYNSALAEISDASRYCKLVQADDRIFPNCLASMVQAFEQSNSIGLVSSYWLKGTTVWGSGFPFPVTLLPGKEVARLYLRAGVYVFGSPTTVMYRSSLVRSQQPFYEETLLHEDSEKCMDILEHWDFGFVHGLLSYLRVDNESISSEFRTLQPNVLDRYILIQRYAPKFLEPAEAAALKKKSRRRYYRVLAKEAIRLREPAFWHYHKKGMATLGETLHWPRLGAQIGLELLWMAANPGTTAIRGIDYLRRRIGSKAGQKTNLISGNESAPPGTGPSSSKRMSTQPNGPPNSQDSQTTQVDEQMSSPLVSVVMAICNFERFLAESIESVLCQSFKDFEFIIVDFGSTDNTKSIVSGYAARDRRIKFHEISPCALPVARNAGCSHAQGEFIAIMDADDISEPNRLTLEVDFMERHPEVALLGGAVEWIDARGKSLGIYHRPSTYAEIKEALATRCPFWHPTVIIRQSAFVSVGGYRAAFVYSHDYDLELRIAEQFECGNLGQVLLKYRVHPYQVSMRRRRQQTLCFLAAQASASSRMIGNPDPLDAIEEIGSAMLAALGVTESMQESKLASDFRDWVRIMAAAGEYSGALTATVEFLQTSDWKHVERWQIADLWLTVAGLRWKQQQFLSSLSAVGHALMASPAVIGRPVKPLLRRAGIL